MKQGRVLAVSIIGTIVMAIFLAYALASREPVSHGKPLSFWIAQIGTPNSGEAGIAIREMGPTAVPFLLKKARSKDGDSPAERLYRLIYNKAPVSIKRRMVLPKPYDDTFHYRVAIALQLLGPAAGPAMIQGMADPNANVRLVALRAATLIGVQADAMVPALVKLVGDPDGRVRREAIIALDNIGPAKKRAMAELIGAPNDSDTFFSAMAARVLGEIGAEAKPALPGLTKLLNTTDAYTRVQSAIAIWRIVGDTNMVSVLMAELDGKADVPTRSWILRALGEMGPVAKPAVPAILRTVQGQRGISNPLGIDLSSVGLKALEKIDPEAAAEAGVK